MIHAYKLGGYNIILDVASGAVHSVDDVAYDAISMFENNSVNEISGFINNKYPEVTESDLAELFSDIEALKLQGKLFSPDIYADIAARTPEKPVKALCMNVSHVCNMSCAYCFANREKYIGETRLMSLETGKRSIDFLVENSGHRKTLDVDFFGGEPLMNWDVVKGIVGYARSAGRDNGKNFRFTLTTNGLLIDDDVIDFTNREMSNVVLSLDGRPGTHDVFRKLPDGTGSYDRVVPKIKRLAEARGYKGYYIRGTYTRENTDFVNDILHLADLGFTELSMEPVASAPGGRHALSQEDLPVLFQQYETLASKMLKRKKEGRGFSFYHFNLDLEGGPCLYKRLAGCGVGTEYMAVTPSGDLYPCHQFVGFDDFLLGDVRSGIKNKELQLKFKQCCGYTRDECKGCWALFYCSGGCAANAYNATGSIDGIYKLGCDIFKKRIECAIMLKVAETN